MMDAQVSGEGKMPTHFAENVRIVLLKIDHVVIVATCKCGEIPT